MTTITVMQRQCLVDLAVQEYGGNWMDGLIDLQRNNKVDISVRPDPGTILVLKSVDINDPVLRTFKRDQVSVVTNKISKLSAPSGLSLTEVTTSSMRATVTSNSGGQENNFEWQIATDLGFTNIVQTQTTGVNDTSYNFSGLDHGTKYYVRCRAIGAIPTSYSNIANAITILDFTNCTVGDGINDFDYQNTNPPKNELAPDRIFWNVWFRFYDESQIVGNDFIFANDNFSGSPQTLWRFRFNETVAGTRVASFTPEGGILGGAFSLSNTDYDKHMVTISLEPDSVNPANWRLKVWFDGILTEIDRDIGLRTNHMQEKGRIALHDLVAGQPSKSKIGRFIRAFDTPITQADVDAAYNGGKGSRHFENLVSDANQQPMLPYNESSGTVIADSSTNGYDLALINYSNTAAEDFGMLCGLIAISGAFTVGEIVTAPGGKSGTVTNWSTPNLRIIKHLGLKVGDVITGTDSGAVGTIDSTVYGAWDEFGD